MMNWPVSLRTSRKYSSDIQPKAAAMLKGTREASAPHLAFRANAATTITAVPTVSQ